MTFLRNAGLLLCVSTAMTGITCVQAPQLDLDDVAESIEDAGRRIVAGEGVESTLEILYGDDGEWTLVTIPTGGADGDALAAAELPERAIRQMRALTGNQETVQLLVQVRGTSVLARTLDPNVVFIPRQTMVSGRGPQWVLARLRKDRERAGYLVDLRLRDK